VRGAERLYPIIQNLSGTGVTAWQSFRGTSRAGGAAQDWTWSGAVSEWRSAKASVSAAVNTNMARFSIARSAAAFAAVEDKICHGTTLQIRRALN